MQKLGHVFKKTIQKLSGQHDLLKYKIVENWEIIVGQVFANITTPMLVKFPIKKTNNGKLVVATSNPGYIIELQMKSDMIIQKINVYFGYHAISNLQFVVKEKI